MMKAAISNDLFDIALMPQQMPIEPQQVPATERQFSCRRSLKTFISNESVDNSDSATRPSVQSGGILGDNKPIQAADTGENSPHTSIIGEPFFVHNIGSGCSRTSHVQFCQPVQEAPGLSPAPASHSATHQLAPHAAYDASAPMVLVAVPTFRRSGLLQRLLEALACLKTNAQVEILVADNDVDRQEGRHAVEALRMSGYRFPIHVIVVAERGLSSVRNAIVEFAQNKLEINYLAMLDDDEWPSTEWLDALLRVQRETDADVVGGWVAPVFEAGAPQWVTTSPLFQNESYATGPVPIIWGTNNVLMKREGLLKLELPLFNPDFGLAGGEDVEAFMRLKAAGYRFAWSREAVVYDSIPLSRSTWRWALRRSFRIGNSNMFAQLRWRFAPKDWWKAYPIVLAQIIIGLTLLSLIAWFPALRARAIHRVTLAFGKAAALFGHRFHEYA